MTDIASTPSCSENLPHLAQPDIRSIEIPAFSLVVRGMCQIDEANQSHPGNEGYNRLRQNISEVTDTSTGVAGAVAKFITGAYRPTYGISRNSLDRMVSKVPENNRAEFHVYWQQQRRPGSFPKAVTFNDISYERLMEIRGLGEGKARAILEYMKTLTRPVTSTDWEQSPGNKGRRPAG